jgi:orotidine 5'-phosphate decarboxylase subfamily 1
VLPRPSAAAGRIVAALDTADLQRAEALADSLAPPRCGVLKVGLELFGAAGPEAVRRVGARAPVFLDLKLHDIPNTVAGAVRALLPLRPAMLTVHAAGGAEMVEAAREAADTAGEARPILLAVTVLTSLGAEALAEPARLIRRKPRSSASRGWRWRTARTGWCARRARPRRSARRSARAAAGGARRAAGGQRRRATRRARRRRPRRWRPAPTGSCSAAR